MTNHADTPTRPVSPLPGVALTRQSLQALGPGPARTGRRLRDRPPIGVLRRSGARDRRRDPDPLQHRARDRPAPDRLSCSALGGRLLAGLPGLAARGRQLAAPQAPRSANHLRDRHRAANRHADRSAVPLGHLLRVAVPTKQIDSSLGAMLGAFLVLHALLHLTLAASVSTSSYLVLSKVINWGTIAVGTVALSAYLRRMRTTATKEVTR